MDKEELKRRAEREIENIDIEFDDSQNIRELIEELQVHQLELEFQNAELRETQEELLKVRNKYHLLYEFAPIAYFTFDKNGVIKNANLQAAELTARQRKFLINKPFMIYVSSESQNIFFNHLRDVIEEESIKQTELKLKNADDKEIEVILESNYVESESYVQSAVINIDKRKEMERKLKKSEAYSRSIIDSIPDVIMKTNYRGENVDIISADEDLLFISEEESDGKSIGEIFESEERDKFLDHIGLAVETGQSQTAEYQLSVPKGKRHFEARFSAINDDEVLVLIRDISERIKKENIIQKYNIELELQQMELEHLYEKLDEELNKAKKVHEKTLFYNNPNLERFSFSAFYQPAEEMGGDFYDIIREGDKLIFYVSDVTGHGLDSAIMSSFIKSTINSYAAAADAEKLNPSDIVKFLAEQFLKENYPEDYFICLVLGVVDLKTDQLKFTEVGIQDPLLFWKGSEQSKNHQASFKSISSPGLPISPVIPIEKLDFRVKKVDLEPGDTLLINTDGITEQRQEGKYYLDRFRELYKDYAKYAPGILSNKLMSDFYNFNDSSYLGDDDITYLILNYRNQELIHHSFELNSTKKEVKRFQNHLDDFLSECCRSDSFIMALNEIIVNSLEHGNKFETDKKIFIEICIGRDYITAEVEDQGSGFDWHKYISKDFDISHADDRGRGIMMAAKGCDDLFYNQKGNKAHLIQNF